MYLLIILFSFLLTLFFPINAQAACEPGWNDFAKGACEDTRQTCSQASGTFEQYTRYYYSSGAACDMVRFYADGQCQREIFQPCTGACFTDQDCGANGLCGGGTPDQICNGDHPYNYRQEQSGACVRVSCGFKCNSPGSASCSEVFANLSNPIPGIQPYNNIIDCQSSAMCRPSPTPTQAPSGGGSPGGGSTPPPSVTNPPTIATPTGRATPTPGGFNCPTSCTSPLVLYDNGGTCQFCDPPYCGRACVPPNNTPTPIPTQTPSNPCNSQYATACGGSNCGEETCYPTTATYIPAGADPSYPEEHYIYSNYICVPIVCEPPPPTSTPTPRPFIQTQGGDVHSNQ